MRKITRSELILACLPLGRPSCVDLSAIPVSLAISCLELSLPGATLLSIKSDDCKSGFG